MNSGHFPLTKAIVSLSFNMKQKLKFFHAFKCLILSIGDGVTHYLPNTTLYQFILAK